jgi:hypothetical protein
LTRFIGRHEGVMSNWERCHTTTGDTRPVGPVAKSYITRAKKLSVLQRYGTVVRA